MLYLVKIHNNSTVQEISYLQFTREKRILREKVFKISAVKHKIEDSHSKYKPLVPEKSDTVVYNRIDKAGSTTLISNLSLIMLLF